MWQKLTQMRHTESSTAATGRGSILRCFPGLLLVLLLCAVSARGQVVINEIVADNNLSLADEDGAFSDWIEIYNTGGVDVNLAGWSLSTTNLARIPSPVLWSFPATNLPAGGYMVIFASEKNRQVAGGALHTNFKIGKDGAKVALANAGVTNDLVLFGLQLQDLSISRVPSGSANWILTTPTPGAANGPAVPLDPPSALRINEWLALNVGGNGSTNEDWLELYNPNTNAVDLSGMIFSDNPAIPVTTSRIMPPLSFIAGSSFFKFTCDSPSPYLEKGADHLNFNLSSTSGETISLFKANDRTNWVDRVTFGPQLANQSEGRLPDGSTNLFQQPKPLPKATPGESNFQKLTGVVINEALSHTDLPLEDAIELFNPNPYATNIGYWWLSNSKDDAKKYQFPEPTTIPAFGFLVVYERVGLPGGFNPNGNGTSPSFTLNSAHGDEIYLATADATGLLTGFRRNVTFGSAANGVSFGRYITSETNTEFVAMSRLTFGSSITAADAPTPGNLALFRSGLGATNPYPVVGPIVISEIMYHPIDILSGTNHIDDTLNEYVELYNITTQPVPLYDTNRYAPPDDPFDYRTNTWKLANEIKFTFPTNVVVPAGGSVVVVNFDPATNATQLAAFRAKYDVPANTPIYGPYGGKLSNSGGTIELYRPDRTQGPIHPDFGFIPFILVEQVKYSDHLPWPLSPDGTGASLQRVTGELYANDPINWTGGTPTPGWQSVRIDSTTPGPNSMVLQFTAMAGRAYRAQFCNSLPAGTWTTFGTFSAQGVTRTLNATNSLAGAGLTRFYRVISP